MSAGHVVVLHDAFAADARADELDALDQAREFEVVLHEHGYTTARLPITLDLAAARATLLGRRPALVVNLVESVGGAGGLQHLAPALLDALRIPYTGAPTAALLLTTDKLLTKRILRLQNLPTPDWLAPDTTGVELEPGRFVIKPIAEDASVGIEDDAVVAVTSTGELAATLAQRAAAFGLALFAERYVAGREFNLALLDGPDGPEVLPPAEIEFIDYAPERPRLVGYRAKWDADSFEYTHTPRRFEFPASDGPLLAELQRLALACWSVFDLRGYARVDFRVDEAGQPWILELNANPCLTPDAGFAAAAQYGGLTSTAVVERILAAALH